MNIIIAIVYFLPLAGLFYTPEVPKVVMTPAPAAEVREVVARDESPARELTPEEYIGQVFGEDARVALAVAKAESGLNATATNHNRNGSIDRGLFQINSVHCGRFDCSRLFDPKYNIEVARQIQLDSGWRAWSVYKNEKYKNY